MTITEQNLKDNITYITNRADLVQETAYALKATAMRVHRVEHFYQDRTYVTQGFSTVTAGDTNNYSYASVDSNYKIRGIESVYDLTNSSPYELVDARDLYDACAQKLTNIWYYAGAETISYVPEKDTTSTRIGMYRIPTYITSANYETDWLVQEFSPLIEVGAAAQIFGMIGMQEEKRNQQELYAEMLQQLIEEKIEIEIR